ncbi:MAG: thiamine pyrophosphate-dependent enzyme [Haloferacaceae archaeon]
MTADQYDCTAIVFAETPDAVVVSNLGVASYVLAAVEDRARNFYQWGSMGVTTPVGLGLALATDEQVTVLDGDGSLLMSLGALSTVGGVDPGNLVVVVFDNGVYGTTGGQPTHAATVDFAAVARGCGLLAERVDTTDGFEAAYREAVAGDGAALVACEVDPVSPDARPPLDYVHVRRRVMAALGTARSGPASDGG